MKIRRIALAVLGLLTVLFIADVRYFGRDDSIKEPSIRFNIGSSFDTNKVEKKQTFTQSQGGFTSLSIKGQQGVIQLISTDKDEIRVTSTIGADNQKILDSVEINQSISGSELSYALTGGRSEDLQDAGVSFVVEVPAGMEVSIEQNFGTVGVRDFVGFLNLNTSFSAVDVWGLEGTAIIQNSFGDLDLRQVAGPITLNDSFSTSTIELLAIDGGYDFDIEVTNGSLKHNAGFQVDISENRVEARE
ncbi:MAG: hypothetical protein M0R49_13340, partial [Limnochordia bacterium]|nr:hypothetical protein [Limnochordia bacterium]